MWFIKLTSYANQSIILTSYYLTYIDRNIYDLKNATLAYVNRMRNSLDFANINHLHNLNIFFI